MADQEPSETLIRRFLRSLIQESDRGCALVGAAHLDRDLEKLIRAALIRASSASKKDLDYLLDSPLAPIRSFSLRIRVAHALGLIPGAVRTTLDAIREIRNDFAHQEDATNFPAKWINRAMEHPLKGWVNPKGVLIEEPEEAAQAFKEFLANAEKWRPKASEMRVKFVYVVIWLRSHFTTQTPAAYPDYYSEDAS